MEFKSTLDRRSRGLMADLNAAKAPPANAQRTKPFTKTGGKELVAQLKNATMGQDHSGRATLGS